MKLYLTLFTEETGSFEDCDSLLHSAVKHDSVMEIKTAGIPVDKLVIGKPARQEDVNNGYMSSSTLASCLSTAKGEGWSAGVMVWQVCHLYSLFFICGVTRHKGVKLIFLLIGDFLVPLCGFHLD